ncbi:MAG: electron transfer flavoprotein subunit alpha/FixB family protein [Acidobacteria bacterium]|nr:electron transfer flavoprotein subunit alpha/FixB family protein [Acidobacteriota bacterium]
MTPGGVLVLAEQRGQKVLRASFEAVRGGQLLARAISAPLAIAILGAEPSTAIADVRALAATEIISVEHPLLEPYTPDAYALALIQLIRSSPPRWVLMSHTYQVRDFAPKMAAALERPLAADVIRIGLEERPVFVRQIYQGKLHAEVSFEGEPPYFVSFQSGAFRSDEAETTGVPPPVIRFEPELSTGDIRTRPLEPFREAKQAVDLTKAEVIVAVGRGIKAREHIALAAKLAEALDGELAASRPICDNEWMPMDRQIGSSGQTVSPKLYVALGISGAIQHLVGMRGSRTVVAINKDPDAPIFDVADYGIVGDLFEIVPTLTTEILKSKGS